MSSVATGRGTAARRNQGMFRTPDRRNGSAARNNSRPHPLRPGRLRRSRRRHSRCRNRCCRNTCRRNSPVRSHNSRHRRRRRKLQGLPRPQPRPATSDRRYIASHHSSFHGRSTRSVRRSTRPLRRPCAVLPQQSLPMARQRRVRHRGMSGNRPSALPSPARRPCGHRRRHHPSRPRNLRLVPPQSVLAQPHRSTISYSSSELSVSRYRSNPRARARVPAPRNKCAGARRLLRPFGRDGPAPGLVRKVCALLDNSPG